MKEMTYCINTQCPFTDCNRHLCRLQKQKGTVKVANLDGVCKRHINYIVDVSWEETAMKALEKQKPAFICHGNVALV